MKETKTLLHKMADDLEMSSRYLRSRSRSPSRDRGCFRCGKDSHRVKDCPEPPTSEARKTASFTGEDVLQGNEEGPGDQA